MDNALSKKLTYMEGKAGENNIDVVFQGSYQEKSGTGEGMLGDCGDRGRGTCDGGGY